MPTNLDTKVYDGDNPRQRDEDATLFSRRLARDSEGPLVGINRQGRIAARRCRSRTGTRWRRYYRGRGFLRYWRAVFDDGSLPGRGHLNQNKTAMPIGKWKVRSEILRNLPEVMALFVASS